ncbi:hypothetical protein BYT27DRAFT_7249852 [Phlegmacium glaucopus]|nr:hypothetical protein BYT27DRAFT_7249852 [Phlegmacium glaucopus]
MPLTTVNTMPRFSQIYTSILNTPSNPATDNISLHEFVNAFILAQRDALEAFNVAKALRLSKETAAAELERRQAVNVTVAAVESQSPPSSRHQRHGSQPIVINKGGNTISHSQHAPLSDEAIGRSLARSWQVDAFQPAGLENRSSPSSSSPKSTCIIDSKAKFLNSIIIINIIFSWVFVSFSFSFCCSHSRSTSQSNTFTDAALYSLTIRQAGLSIQDLFEAQETSKDDKQVSGENIKGGRRVANLETLKLGAAPRAYFTEGERACGYRRSDRSTPPFSQFQTSDIMHAKRRRTEHKPSLNVVVVARPISEPQKSSTFLRNLRPGTIISTAKDNSASSMSMSEGPKSLLPPPPPPPSKPIKVPKQKAYCHDPFNDVHKCPHNAPPPAPSALPGNLESMSSSAPLGVESNLIILLDPNSHLSCAPDDRKRSENQCLSLLTSWTPMCGDQQFEEDRRNNHLKQHRQSLRDATSKLSRVSSCSQLERSDIHVRTYLPNLTKKSFGRSSTVPLEDAVRRAQQPEREEET